MSRQYQKAVELCAVGRILVSVTRHHIREGLRVLEKEREDWRKHDRSKKKGSSQ